MSKITLALIVTKPGHLCNGLQSLLRTVPQIEIIAETQDPSVLLKVGTEIHPELVLLDADLFDEDAWTAVVKLKGEWPQTQCVALVDNDQQRQNAQEAGVDLVLPKGYPAQKLVELIENIIDRREDTPPVESNTEE
jgi:DNA-binding NarL/FixJ family response regulator